MSGDGPFAEDGPAAVSRPNEGARPNEHQSGRVGPILFFRDCQDQSLDLAAIIIQPEDESPPAVTTDDTAAEPEVLHQRDGLVVLRYRFSLPAATGGSYAVAGKRFEVAGISAGDLRMAYVSCNGQEEGDRERPLAVRNALWQRLTRQHAAEPLNLLLHGGDQLYADEMLDVHPVVRAWSDGEVTGAQTADLEAVGEQLRSYLLKSYVGLFSQSAPAQLLARVPSLCMWDDHDICDGWGSLPAKRLDSAVGQAVFRAAREFFLLFQLGSPADDPPPICLDETGATLSWAAKLPGVLLLAPDLRSQRRPEQVLDECGWRTLRQGLSAAGDDRVFFISSVPVLGPRLSWLEAAMHCVPRAQKYEDDLRDQWQSRWHREEWRRLLRELLSVHEREQSQVTVLSGEIHLATRGTMVASGPPLHQLVASGITHPPPPSWYARALGALAWLGESPIESHPIRLHPLPGQRGIYTAQRNYLMLQRRDGRWSAWWELEHDGPTPALPLDA